MLSMGAHAVILAVCRRREGGFARALGSDERPDPSSSYLVAELYAVLRSLHLGRRSDDRRADVADHPSRPRSTPRSCSTAATLNRSQDLKTSRLRPGTPGAAVHVDELDGRLGKQGTPPRIQ